MGGLDARYLASPNGMNQGNRILSITTLGTPHRGACIADVFTPPLRTFVSLLAWASHYATLDDESRVFLSEIADNNWGALKQLSPRYLEEEFNPKIIDHPDVVYFSYAGCLNKRLRSLFDLPRRCRSISLILAKEKMMEWSRYAPPSGDLQANFPPNMAK